MAQTELLLVAWAVVASKKNKDRYGRIILKWVSKQQVIKLQENRGSIVVPLVQLCKLD
jgi:hypothetical protein